MEEYYLHLIETIVILVIHFVLKYLTKKATIKAALKFSKSASRVNIVGKIINLILITTALTLILLIWGVEQSELMLFITSILTVLGIAFFAQWSIISNITATLIIFFNHPAKMGDEIEVFDIDHPVKGTINDIGIFFVTIKNKEGGLITIPSNLFIQKMISKKSTNQKRITD
ncbi:mechanosensitive ion channel protein MscS [Brumimicrobium salinarum]|uniref:Mechanosensitive ion channel protein MscS n=1 Tax=Brumimicrobium salinarum TaxID=2058658 RepID=A0A2I0R627_9FLAO|nr:mechanosensitive ion channel domain-containing protein [Brumimicrobium salinarum]PKR82036.1 mechanosensitive ion channel protein MscS [Brumimicrobium salinarum]